MAGVVVITGAGAGRQFISRKCPRAIYFAATHMRRDVWVGFPTDKRARRGSREMFTDRHRTALLAAAVMGAGALLHQIAERLDV